MMTRCQAALKIRKIGIVVGVMCLCVALLPTRADAAFILQVNGTDISDCFGVAVCPAGGDTDPTEGAISYSNTVAGVAFETSTALSKPILTASTSFAEISLSTQARAVDANGGTLFINVTDTDFPAPIGPGTFDLSVAGSVVSNATVSFTAFKDPNNVQFGSSTTTVALGPFSSPFGGGPDAFGSDTHLTFPDPYSMSIFSTIVLNNINGRVNIDSSAVNIPEPFSLSLFGTGLVGLGVAAARRRRRPRPLLQ